MDEVKLTIDESETDSYPSFANLPMEIILKIFRYLNFGDIQSASLTCHRWLEASEYYEFQSNVQLKFSKICLSDNSGPGEIFTKSYRSFKNLYLDETVCGTLTEFFQILGKTLDTVKLSSIDLTNKQFCAIMKEMKNIKNLTLENCSSLFMAGQFLESIDDRNEIQQQMSNIRSLSLRHNQYLSDAILLRLTSLIDGLEKLDMCGCHVAYHNGIQRRFYPPNLESQPIESILTFKYLLKVVENHAKTLKEIDLSYTLIGGPALSALADLPGLDLRKITLNFCRQLNFTGLNTMGEMQKNLVELNISSSDGINDSCVELLTENLIKLEIFRLKKCRKLTNVSAIAIAKLKLLKLLDLSLCDGISSEGIQNGIASVRNERLIELHLVAIDLFESCVIQCAENLPNLRIFDIGSCINGVTDRSVQAIIKNLVWLKVLNLENCILITDAAITGIDVQSQISSEFIDNSTESIDTQGDTNDLNSVKISLRSKAEQEIVEDAERKKALLAIYEMNLIDDNNREGLSIRSLKGLESLNLRGCSKISDVSLKYGLKFSELRRLLLSNCQQISAIGLEALIQNCSSIEDLDLSDCYNINDNAIDIVCSGLKRLKYINISGCAQLTDHSLDSIVLNCKNLQSISLNRCRRMCSDIDYLIRNLPTLRNLNMDPLSRMENAENYGFKKRMDY